MTSHRIGKYACLEIESRYLLNKIPEDLIQNDGWLITDRYFPETRLRLRRMKSISGDKTLFKLTQKYRSEGQNTTETTITNLYLTETEYNLFKPLKARIIGKRRYPYPLQHQHFSIDVFEGRHQGLILAELELGEGEGLDGTRLPLFAHQDVTADPFFTGGNLSRLSAVKFREELARRLCDFEKS